MASRHCFVVDCGVGISIGTFSVVLVSIRTAPVRRTGRFEPFAPCNAMKKQPLVEIAP
jgi:hypothetical protein